MILGHFPPWVWNPWHLPALRCKGDISANSHHIGNPSYQQRLEKEGVWPPWDLPAMALPSFPCSGSRDSQCRPPFPKRVKLEILSNIAVCDFLLHVSWQSIYLDLWFKCSWKESFVVVAEHTLGTVRVLCSWLGIESCRALRHSYSNWKPEIILVTPGGWCRKFHPL